MHRMDVYKKVIGFDDRWVWWMEVRDIQKKDKDYITWMKLGFKVKFQNTHFKIVSISK